MGLVPLIQALIWVGFKILIALTSWYMHPRSFGLEHHVHTLWRLRQGCVNGAGEGINVFCVARRPCPHVAAAVQAAMLVIDRPLTAFEDLSCERVGRYSAPHLAEVPEVVNELQLPLAVSYFCLQSEEPNISPPIIPLYHLQG